MKTNKKGFTLIEIILIIVILSIIAIITVPAILKVIRSSKENSFLASSYGVMEAAKLKLSKDFLKNKNIEELIITYPENTGILDISGIEPDSGRIIVRINGQIGFAFWNNELKICVTKSYAKAEAIIDRSLTTKESCNIGTVLADTDSSEYELMDGWMRITLYYPESSTERKWRLGEEGELRTTGIFFWQDYNGPIYVPISRIEDIWISYMLNDKEVIVPPTGKLLVDINPIPTGSTLVKEVNVKINYDESANIKEYRIGGSDWLRYTGEFKVTENTIIEARAKKIERIYDENGNLIATTNIGGSDSVYIGNIGVEEIDLEAPIIERISPINDKEVARLRIIYPDDAAKKIFKKNYGIEESYSEEISVKTYGTHILAYYYNSEGKRSKGRSILINDTSTGQAPNQPTTYTLNNPYVPNNPGTSWKTPPKYEHWIKAPDIIISPNNELTESVKVSINYPSDADKVYIKLGRYGKYEEYINPIEVKENNEIHAYYRTYEGYRSQTGYSRISNIKQGNKPYVYIDADPYPYNNSYGHESVQVTINYQDSNVNEYSLDGINYLPYIEPFIITKNTRIYARAKNDYGIKEDYLDITNIGVLKQQMVMKKIDISINAVPEPSVSEKRYNEVKITIDYGENANKKYYKIGKFGELKEYKGSFIINKNTTIYAYATGDNSKGEALKLIDNLLSGISEPIITVSPKYEHTNKVIVNISYDKHSKIKNYSINSGNSRDYVGSFEVTKNDTIIRAYSENEFGEKSESTYVIENIIEEPPMLILDKGKYYLIKINYPKGAITKEYKWMDTGTWKEYKKDGILLIKTKYKNDLLKDGLLLKIEDENGNIVTFKGDYYLIDVPINEINDNLYIRWNKEIPPVPQIVLSTTEVTKELTATIIYDKTIVKKEYKLVDKDGKSTGWLEYKEPIKVNEKNTTIYARATNTSEVTSNENIKKITNIDNEKPNINLTGEFLKPQQKVNLRVTAFDDISIGKIKYEIGKKSESYFKNNGKEIANNSVVTITENGEYTFYVEDKVGNFVTKVINITNIDKTAPSINISSKPKKVGTTSTITIDYGDSVLKEYKIGASNSTWSTYSGEINLSSYTVLSKNWQNEDLTLSVYARGKDIAGNEIVVEEKILNLDLDMPDTPVINSNYGYPLLTSYGVILDGLVNITYDSRKDIDNYYSIDNGSTWKLYEGPFDYPVGTIMAKSIKKDTELQISTSKTISMPSDAISIDAYDGDDTTYYETWNTARKYMNIDRSIQGKAVRIYLYTAGTNNSLSGYDKIIFLDSDDNIVETISVHLWKTTYNNIITIPKNAVRLAIYAYSRQCYIRLYEIQPSNEPKFTAENGYMLLHADPYKAIRNPYQMITINYYPTSIQKLYKIGEDGMWMDYQDSPIKVEQGETIYAKGIDKYGIETRIVSSHTVNVTDAMLNPAFDDNTTTYYQTWNTTRKYMDIDPSMQGKSARIYLYTAGTNNSLNGYDKIIFLDSDGNIVETISIHLWKTTYNKNVVIPINAVRMGIYAYSGQCYINFYEIYPV